MCWLAGSAQSGKDAAVGTPAEPFRPAGQDSGSTSELIQPLEALPGRRQAGRDNSASSGQQLCGGRVAAKWSSLQWQGAATGA